MKRSFYVKKNAFFYLTKTKMRAKNVSAGGACTKPLVE